MDPDRAVRTGPCFPLPRRSGDTPPPERIVRQGNEFAPQERRHGPSGPTVNGHDPEAVRGGAATAAAPQGSCLPGPRPAHGDAPFAALQPMLAPASPPHARGRTLDTAHVGDHPGLSRTRGVAAAVGCQDRASGRTPCDSAGGGVAAAGEQPGRVPGMRRPAAGEAGVARRWDTTAKDETDDGSAAHHRHQRRNRPASPAAPEVGPIHGWSGRPRPDHGPAPFGSGGLRTSPAAGG